MANILLIDDEPVVQSVVSAMLRQHEHHVVVAENGREGLRLAQEATPDLIICDIAMPVLSGAEMVAECRKDPALARVPIIMLTGVGRRDMVMHLITLGIQGYLLKPLRMEALLAKVNEVVGN
jgi:DNA-binding response OmpR family regulator